MSGCGKLEMSAVKESGGIGVGTDRDEREACFLEFARDIAADAGMPVMTTGDIRHREVAEPVLAQRVAVAGIATAPARNLRTQQVFAPPRGSLAFSSRPKHASMIRWRLHRRFQYSPHSSMAFRREFPCRFAFFSH